MGSGLVPEGEAPHTEGAVLRSSHEDVPSLGESEAAHWLGVEALTPLRDLIPVPLPLHQLHTDTDINH